MNTEEHDELMALAAELPKEIHPDRDLLPEISALAWRQPELRIVPGASDRPGFVRALFPYRTQLAAAAVVLVALTAAMTAVLLRGPAAPDLAESPAVAVSASLARYEAAEASYAVVIDQLTRALDAHRSELTPEIVELIESNLAVIDQALAESLAALEGSPADPTLRRAVSAAYEQKVGLLRQASALTTGL